MTGPAVAEPVVWRGTPAPRASLLTYVALAGAATGATGALLFVGQGRDAAGGERSLGALVPWLITLTWLLCAAGAVGAYLRSRSTRYVLTAERLRVTTGLLSTTTQELELRRVRDTVVVRPLLLRLLGLGHVMLLTADASTPRVTLQAVPEPEQLQSTIRSFVQQSYRGGAVREIDVL